MKTCPVGDELLNAFGRTDTTKHDIPRPPLLVSIPPSILTHTAHHLRLPWMYRQAVPSKRLNLPNCTVSRPRTY